MGQRKSMRIQKQNAVGDSGMTMSQAKCALDGVPMRTNTCLLMTFMALSTAMGVAMSDSMSLVVAEQDAMNLVSYSLNALAMTAVDADTCMT